MPLRRFWRDGALALASWMLLFGLTLGQSDEAVKARMRKDVTYLASDECEGRGVDTAGIQKAATYIAAEFAKAGLKPGGVNGTYFQPFTISGRRQAGRQKHPFTQGTSGTRNRVER